MPYYPTLAEDVARAKAILAKGKPAHDEVAYLPSEELRAAALAGGTIYGADVYAAYKLLESFVEVIERWEAERIVAVTARCSVCGAFCDDIEFERAGQPAGECLCRTAGCGHAARLHVGGICQACRCEGWR